MYRSLSSPRRVLVQVAASGLLAGTLVAAPVNAADTGDGSSGLWVEAVTERRQPESLENDGMRLWSDIHMDRSDAGVVVEQVDPVPGSATYFGGLSVEFSSPVAAAIFAGAVAHDGSVESVNVSDGDVVTVRASDDASDDAIVGRLARLAERLDDAAAPREFSLGEYSLFGSAPASNDEWQNTGNYASIDLADLWADFDTAGATSDVVIAILDTGLYAPSRDIPVDRYATDASGALLQYNAFTGDEGDGVTFDAVKDHHGHGTFIANQIVGEIGNEIGSFGVCESRCKVLPVKVLGDDGSGDNIGIADGIEWAVDNGADVISMSLGMVAPLGAMDDPAFAEMQAPMLAALEHAAANDVVVMAAAGNHGTSWQHAEAAWPAAFEQATAVAAADADGNRLSFSAWSEWEGGVEISAPGCVYADLDTAHVFSDGQATAGEWCGTSMATPIAAAVAAMTRAVFPDYDRDQIVDRISGFAAANDYTMYGNLVGTDVLDPAINPAPLPTPPVAPIVSWDTSVLIQCNADNTHNVKITVENQSDDAELELLVMYRPSTLESPETRHTTAVPVGETITFEYVWPVNHDSFFYVSHEFYPDPWGEWFYPVDGCWYFDTGTEIVFTCYQGDVWVDVKVDASRDINVTPAAGFITFPTDTWGRKVSSFGVWPSQETPTIEVFKQWKGNDFYTDHPFQGQGFFIVEPGWWVRSSSELVLPGPNGREDATVDQIFTPEIEVPDMCADGETDFTPISGSTLQPATTDLIPTDDLWTWSNNPESRHYTDPDPVEGCNNPEDCGPDDGGEDPGFGDDPEFDDPDDAPGFDEPLESVPGSRLLDTRGPGTADGLHEGAGELQPNQVMYLQVSGRGGLPADATSATLSLVGVGSHGHGHVTVWPCNDELSTAPNTSVLNVAPGWTRANVVTTKLGDHGGVCITSNTTLHLVADVQAFTSESSPLQPTDPTRIYDSRTATTGKFGFNETRRIDVSAELGLDEHPDAAWVNITTVAAEGDGFVTVWPCAAASDPMPNASILNFVGGDAVANNSLVGLIDGGFCLFSWTPSHLIVDVTATMAPNDQIIPITPQRFIDTREMNAWHLSSTGESEAGRYAAQETRMFNIGAVHGGDVTGIIANFTVVGPEGSNHLTTWPCDSPHDPPPNTSNLNYNTGWSATPGNSIQALSADGNICVFSYAAADLIIDITALVRG